MLMLMHASHAHDPGRLAGENSRSDRSEFLDISLLLRHLFRRAPADLEIYER
jgi:hypothetical protein